MGLRKVKDKHLKQFNSSPPICYVAHECLVHMITVITNFSEITDRYIYMLMECGNLDLNTWLRNRKTVNSLERKFYWRNMLEAVQTIHKHGDYTNLTILREKYCRIVCFHLA